MGKSNKKKRALALCLALMMALSSAACSDNDTDESEGGSKKTKGSKDSHSISIDTASEEDMCPDCKLALEYYTSMMGIANRLDEPNLDWINTEISDDELEFLSNHPDHHGSINNSPDDEWKNEALEKAKATEIYKGLREYLKETQDKLAEASEHDCDAKVEQVENYPYVCNNYIGFYTGDWKGSAPCGKGTFNGRILIGTFEDQPNLGSYIDNTLTNNYNINMIYSGDWKGGRPDGTGLTIKMTTAKDPSDFIRYVQEMYYGDYKNGSLNGNATVMNVFNRTDITEGERITYFDEGNYVDGVLQGTVDFAQYDDQGLLAVGQGVPWNHENMTGGYGLLIPDDNYTNVREEAERYMEQAQTFAATIGILGTMYIGVKVLDSLDPMSDFVNYWSPDNAAQQNADLQENLISSFAQKEEEARKFAEEQNRIEEENRKNAENNYYDAIKNDPDEYYLKTKQYKWQAGLGY